MKNLDFAKILIWACLVLAVAGVGSHFYLKARFEQAKKDGIRALQVLKDIAIAKADIDALETERSNDDYLENKRNNRLNTFFDAQARQAGMVRGPSVDPPKDVTPSRVTEYTDTERRLYWQKVGRQEVSFDRVQITKFLWWLESKTRLLRVTEMRLEDGRDKQDDQWQLNILVTERSPVAPKSS